MSDTWQFRWYSVVIGMAHVSSVRCSVLHPPVEINNDLLCTHSFALSGALLCLFGASG